jgi:hypothetical protein
MPPAAAVRRVRLIGVAMLARTRLSYTNIGASPERSTTASLD